MRFDIDRPVTLAALIWIGVVSVYTTVVLPLIVTSAATTYRLAAADAGPIASAEMGGVAIGTLLSVLVVARADRRRMVVVGALLAAAANLASIVPLPFTALLPLRVLSGAGSGVLLAVMAAAVGATRAPDRNFAIFVAAAFVAAAVSFGVLSAITAARGAVPLFGLLAVLNLSTLAVTPLVPRRAPIAQAGEDAVTTGGRVATPAVIAALGGILAFYLGVGSVWPMMSAIGTTLGIAPAVVARVLASTSIAALIGATAATVLAVRLGRALPLIVGLTLTVASLVWLGSKGPAAFGLAPLLFLLGWNFSVPYMMGTLAVLDRSGRAVAFNMTLQYVGFACGPLFAAGVAAHAGLAMVIWVGVLGCGACLLQFAAALRLGSASV